MSYSQHASVLAALFALSATTLYAQAMPGMDMPATRPVVKPTPKRHKTPAPRPVRRTAKPVATPQPQAPLQAPAPATPPPVDKAADTPGMDMSGMDMTGKAMPDAKMMAPDKVTGMGKPMDQMAMPGAASKWRVMTHVTLTAVADSQGGPRGGDKNFVEGMAMVMANRALDSHNDLALELMVSPDAFMGKSGYPLLLQTGETADGVTALVDRQHPHDLFMGATATLTHHVDATTSAFVTLGYPGEFAFGPPAFMHRGSGEAFPTAPISHHWLDSGHITMGVVTGSIQYHSIKLETSAFTGREPDQHRFNLDPIHLDSNAVRATWQVTPDLSAEVSWARQVSPEQLEPDVNLIKHAASLAYGHDFAAGRLDSTLAFGRRRAEHGGAKPLDAWLFENTFSFKGPWTALARYERVDNDELAPGRWWVAKTELGGVYTMHVNGWTTLGFGVVEQFNSVPEGLKASYGDHPRGTVGFIRLKFNSMPDMESKSAMGM